MSSSAVCAHLDAILDRCEGEVPLSAMVKTIEDLVVDATSARNVLVRIRDEGLAG